MGCSANHVFFATAITGDRTDALYKVTKMYLDRMFANQHDGWTWRSSGLRVLYEDMRGLWSDSRLAPRKRELESYAGQIDQFQYW